MAENIVQRESTLGLLQVNAAIRQWNEEISGARGGWHGKYIPKFLLVMWN